MSEYEFNQSIEDMIIPKMVAYGGICQTWNGPECVIKWMDTGQEVNAMDRIAFLSLVIDERFSYDPDTGVYTVNERDNSCDSGQCCSSDVSGEH